jgi:hypothetical protein
MKARKPSITYTLIKSLFYDGFNLCNHLKKITVAGHTPARLEIIKQVRELIILYSFKTSLICRLSSALAPQDSPSNNIII